MQRVIKKNKPQTGFVCIVCDYLYIPEMITGESRFKRETDETFDKNWQCPECGAGRSCFREIKLGEEDGQCS